MMYSLFLIAVVSVPVMGQSRIDFATVSVTQDKSGILYQPNTVAKVMWAILYMPLLLEALLIYYLLGIVNKVNVLPIDVVAPHKISLT
jgi:hypothetical protein